MATVGTQDAAGEAKQNTTFEIILAEVTALDDAFHQRAHHETAAPIQNYRDIVKLLRASAGREGSMYRRVQKDLEKAGGTSLPPSV